jgi:hypothetical protein
MADNTTITFTCTNTTSGFPDSFGVTVTATATDTYGCSGTASNTTTVTALCCGSGTAMATSKDTTNSTSVCLRTLSCGSNNGGFFNRLLVNESAADYTMVVGAG